MPSSCHPVFLCAVVYVQIFMALQESDQQSRQQLYLSQRRVFLHVSPFAQIVTALQE